MSILHFKLILKKDSLHWCTGRNSWRWFAIKQRYDSLFFVFFLYIYIALVKGRAGQKRQNSVCKLLFTFIYFLFLIFIWFLQSCAIEIEINLLVILFGLSLWLWNWCWGTWRCLPSGYEGCCFVFQTYTVFITQGHDTGLQSTDVLDGILFVFRKQISHLSLFSWSLLLIYIQVWYQ